MADLSLPEQSDSPKSYLHTLDNKIKSLEESTYSLKRYRNTFVPISRLPTEILSNIFKFTLPASFGILDFLPVPIVPSYISHVCHRWRDISLNMPYLWSHINFAQLTPAGATEMLARAKMAPLHLKAKTSRWSTKKFETFLGQIEAHIHHTRHLSIMATPQILEQTFRRLVSSAPSLEQFFIVNRSKSNLPVTIPVNIFDGIAPKLISLRLDNCGIHWKSPSLKGLRDLELSSFPMGARTNVNTWLDALNQMSQLEKLSLRDGIPIHSVVPLPVIPVVLSSLTKLDISASARECVAVLAHLVLPALTRLCVNVQSHHPTGRDVQNLVPYVAHNANGPQDVEGLQSLFVGGNRTRTEIVAWAMPRQDTDDGFCKSGDLTGVRLVRVAFSVLNRNWRLGMDIRLYDTLLTALPLNSITSLTVKGRKPLSRWVWHNHALAWHRLERVRLSRTAVPAFREMLEDAPRGGSLLPSLEELVLINVSLNAQKVFCLRNMLIKLIELKSPLRTLDLRTCIASNRAVRLLSEIVVDVKGPDKESRDFYNKRRGRMDALDSEGEGYEEYGFDDMSLFLGSWDWDIGDADEYDTDDDDDGDSDDDGSGDSDDDDSGDSGNDNDDDDETSSADSDFDLQ